MTPTCWICGAALDAGGSEPLVRVVCRNCGQKNLLQRTFDHFVPVETLGAGGMGTVYKARDTQLERFVALKLLRKDVSSEADHDAQLQQEARIAASVNHPNVVQIFSLGMDHGQFYLAMELIDNGSLDDLMESQGRLTEHQVLDIGIQIARGLRAAHRKGLIHPDVKAANMLFVDEQAAKIGDFGLAAFATQQSQHTESDRVVWGTRPYVAPERLNNQPEDVRSDIYSLGATLFHAVAGRPPFDGETMSAADLRALKNNPLKLKDVAPEVSRPTAATIARMIAPDPRLRFDSHDAVIQALQKSKRILRGESEPWRAKAALALAAAALFALLLFGWIFFVRPRAPAKSAAMASATPSFDVNREFDAGRRQIIDGSYSKARATFARLASETKNKQPIYDWALLNQAVAALLDRQYSIMHQALHD